MKYIKYFENYEWLLTNSEDDEEKYCELLDLLRNKKKLKPTDNIIKFINSTIIKFNGKRVKDSRKEFKYEINVNYRDNIVITLFFGQNPKNTFGKNTTVTSEIEVYPDDWFVVVYNERLGSLNRDSCYRNYIVDGYDGLEQFLKMLCLVII